MYEQKEKIESLLKTILDLKTKLKFTDKDLELKKLEEDSMHPDFWDDQVRAKSIMQKISDINLEKSEFESLFESIKFINTLCSEGGFDEAYIPEIEALSQKLNKFLFKTFLSGKYDSKNAIVSIHAGQGGTEAMDWTSMLFRMYLRYAERNNWDTETMDVSEGEEAGIKAVTFKVSGSYAYGYLKFETGTHRLVRLSPFNANNLRQTSFALVGIMPELENADTPDISLKDEDLDWQFYRSGGHGGQNVNKVSTAVRLKHIPTGVVVTCQTERFQEQNRNNALSLLRAKLWVLEEERRKNQISEIKGEYRPASWGNQIRSYVLHPYKMVKDLRTETVSNNPEEVLDGNIDQFIESEIRHLYQEDQK